MDPMLSKKLIELGSDVASKPTASFSELLALKFFGKSIAKLKAEAAIEHDKTMTKWEELDKPVWIEAEMRKVERQYSNMGSVIQKASSGIENINPEIDDGNDMFWGLLEHSKEISNEDVQDLIAKIIAGEYNSPGTYSMSTLQVLKSLGKKDLEKLEFFGSFYIPWCGFVKDFFSMEKPVLDIRVKLGISYSNFLELQNLGLIQTGDYSSSISLKKGEQLNLGPFVIEAKKDFDSWSFPGCWRLTVAGREIMQHLQVSISNDFKEWAQDYFQQKGFRAI